MWVRRPTSYCDPTSSDFVCPPPNPPSDSHPWSNWRFDVMLMRSIILLHFLHLMRVISGDSLCITAWQTPSNPPPPSTPLTLTIHCIPCCSKLFDVCVIEKKDQGTGQSNYYPSADIMSEGWSGNEDNNMYVVNSWIGGEKKTTKKNTNLETSTFSKHDCVLFCQGQIWENFSILTLRNKFPSYVCENPEKAQSTWEDPGVHQGSRQP